MLFNTWTFALFLIIVLALYALLRRSIRGQNLLLLVASYVFYGWWDLRFLLLIVFSTAVDYTAGLLIARGELSAGQRRRVSLFVFAAALAFLGPNWSSIELHGISPHVDWGVLLRGTPLGWACVGATGGIVAIALFLHRLRLGWSEAARRRAFVTLSVVVNLGLLAYFKYAGFFAESLADLVETLGGSRPSDWTLDIVLPVGISFYTFQTMSYTIDVYRRDVDASESLLDFATYVAFFPQLVAGPIERGKHLLPQFARAREPLNGAAWRSSLWLIFWGLYKKMVVADNMAIVANTVFFPFDSMYSEGGAALPVPEDGLRLAVGLLAFAFQIYGDFSGYTDMARGVARLFGFEVILNFHLPYFATSPSDFWRRWHISLSSWLRDYLYIPLGGNRGTGWYTYRNLFLTMLLGGLWHGAAWTFILWGAYHGALLSFYRAIGLRTEEQFRPLIVRVGLGVVMFALTCGGWLIFRAQNVATIRIFIESIFLHPAGSEETWELVVFGFRSLWFLLVFQVIQAWTGDLDPMRRWPLWVRLPIWVFIIVSILALSRKTGKEFIYFAF